MRAALDAAREKRLYDRVLHINGREEKAYRLDRWSVVILPLLFCGWRAWAVWSAVRH